MKKLVSLLAVTGMIMFSASSAFALSTEQPGNDINTDGTAKFQDPDEQQPAFMVGPGSSQSGMRVMPFSGGPNPVTPPTPGDYSQGAAAFDKAYSHFNQ